MQREINYKVHTAYFSEKISVETPNLSKNICKGKKDVFISLNSIL